MSTQVYFSFFLVIVGIGNQKIINGYIIDNTIIAEVTKPKVQDNSKNQQSNENVYETQPEYDFYKNLYPQLYNFPSFILEPARVRTSSTSKQFGEIFNLINPGCSVSTPIGTLILPIRQAAFTATNRISAISPRFGPIFSNMKYSLPSHLEYVRSSKQLNGILNLINPACSISTPIGTLVLPIRDAESSENAASSL